MTGTPDAVRPPADDAEWARATEKRLGQLENPTAVRVGSWVLSESEAGHLLASHSGGGNVVIARKPPDGEADPEATLDAIPEVTVLRVNPQAISNQATVMWDGSRIERGGDWTSGKSVTDALVVPVSGYYTVVCSLQWNLGSGWPTSVVLVDGQTRLTGRTYDNGGEWLTSLAVGRLALYAGQSVSVIAYLQGSRSIGSATMYAQPIPCELSLVMSGRID